jgi:hypothetical protein
MDDQINLLEKDFYRKVEEPGYLKHILYGDSVAKYTTIDIQLNDNITYTLTFNDLWEYLINKLNKEVIYQNDKEYIFLTYEFKILSYHLNSDKLIYEYPSYIMRHSIKDDLISLQLTNFKYIDVTKNHSLIGYTNNNLYIVPPYYCNEVLVNKLNFPLSKLIDYNNIKNLKGLKVLNKNKIEYNDYVYDICNPSTQMFFANNILVHNTDSIIFKIPTKNTEQLELSELWDRAEITAENINKLIIDYTKNILLPRSNINPERNQTFFKTELLMESILLLDVKKKYAYKLLIKEGKILNPPKISYTGIEVIKSNGIKITQEMLKKIIEDIALEVKLNLTEKKENTVKTIEIFYNNFIEAVNSFNFEYIGIPGKWSKDKQIINGMKLYNHIMNEHIFEQSSSGRFLYIKSVNIGEFKNSVGICIPYSFNIDILKEKFKIFNIEIDMKTQWSKIFNTTCERVIKIIKSVN